MRKTCFLLLMVFLAACVLHGQARPRLAILPFTGENAGDAESIAEFFSYQEAI
jgi:hypothetical protein